MRGRSYQSTGDTQGGNGAIPQDEFRLRVSRGWLAAELPRLIHHAARGDFAPVAQIILAAGETTQEYAYIPLIECSEPWACFRLAQTARLSAGSFERDAVPHPAPEDAWSLDT